VQGDEEEEGQEGGVGSDEEGEDDDMQASDEAECKDYTRKKRPRKDSMPCPHKTLRMAGKCDKAP
jgi:hypothetical protein